MAENTKTALRQALKDRMKEKPLEKIRIKELTEACGINRQSFYYYYADIYDLIKDILETDIEQAVGQFHSMDNWEEGMLGVYEMTRENRDFIVAVYNALPKETLQYSLETIFKKYMFQALSDTAGGSLLGDEDREIFMNFCCFGFTGTYLHWIQNGMMEDPQSLMDRLSVFTKEGLMSAIIRCITPNPEEK